VCIVIKYKLFSLIQIISSRYTHAKFIHSFKVLRHAAPYPNLQTYPTIIPPPAPGSVPHACL